MDWRASTRLEENWTGELLFERKSQLVLRRVGEIRLVAGQTSQQLRGAMNESTFVFRFVAVRAESAIERHSPCEDVLGVGRLGLRIAGTHDCDWQV